MKRFRNIQKQRRSLTLAVLLVLSLLAAGTVSAFADTWAVEWDSSWTYAQNSKIHSGTPVLYYTTVSPKKGLTVCINAGHGTKGGTAVQTLCHPDGTPKVTSGSTSAGATMATAVAAGTTMLDGTSEAAVTLKAALAIKDMLLNRGYDVLMIRESDDIQLDNVGRTVLANNIADCHISIHYDATTNNKGAFYCSVPDVASYRNMEPVASHWKDHEYLGECLIQGLRAAGVTIFGSGASPQDLTQTSYSTIPSVDLEVGDRASDYSAASLQKIAAGIADGLDTFSKAFLDVPSDAYYHAPVQWAVEKGITGGYSAIRFGPDLSCTRAQMVTFLWRAAGSPTTAVSVNPFQDVSSDAYYYQAVLWAVNKGVTAGTGDNTFSPDMIVDRGQVVTFLWRAAGSPDVRTTGTEATYHQQAETTETTASEPASTETTSAETPTAGTTNTEGSTTEPTTTAPTETGETPATETPAGTDNTTPTDPATTTEPATPTETPAAQPEQPTTPATPTTTEPTTPAVTAVTNPFTDVAEADYFYQAVLWAVQKGITQGTGPDTFSPADPCTRAQAVTFMYRSR